MLAIFSCSPRAWAGKAQYFSQSSHAHRNELTFPSPHPLLSPPFQYLPPRIPLPLPRARERFLSLKYAHGCLDSFPSPFLGSSTNFDAMDDAAVPASTLICHEDGSDLLLDDADDLPAAAAAGGGGEHFLDGDAEYVELLLSKERAAAGAGSSAGAAEAEDWVKPSRAGCVRWILRTGGNLGFAAKTACIAVAYLDRFLEHRRIDRGKEWALQLLSVACLSLAAKVEELRAPPLPEFRLDGYEFSSASIMRMELLVLATLKWQMISATPFSYLGYFASKFCSPESNGLIQRATRCVFAAIKVMNSLDYRPSTVAAAAILVASTEELTRSLLDSKMCLASLHEQLDIEHVYSCCNVMIQEEKSMQSNELASSNVSVANSMDANNATTCLARPVNKRQRLHSPEAQ